MVGMEMEEEWGGAEARPRMAVEPGMVVKEEAEDGDSVNTSTSSPDKALLTRLLPVCRHGPMSQSPGPGL